MNENGCWLCSVAVGHDPECPYTIAEVEWLSDVHPLDDFIGAPDLLIGDDCLREIEEYSSVSNEALGRAKGER